ncbi:MAG: hypothetical protein JXX28_19415, partial [Deltaproteobacteria bacterium]|nr:hypothetical protein [Deltaproteobacteria bacterium]
LLSIALALSGCHRVSGGAVWNQELECWDAETHPPIEYVGDITTVQIDEQCRCWVIFGIDRPEGKGWGTQQCDEGEEPCPETELSPSCYDLYGYDPE